MKQKLFSLLVAIVAGITALQADGIQIGNLYYNLDVENETAEITFEYDDPAINYDGLTSIDIPAFVTNDGKSYHVTQIGEKAFWGCNTLLSANIGDNVTSIGDMAFCLCENLTSVIIGNSVTDIGRLAFDGCSGLTSFTCAAVNPPVCDESTFGNVNKSIPLYVPEGSIDAYKEAAGWKEFININFAYTLYYYCPFENKYAVWYWKDGAEGTWTDWMTGVSDHTGWYKVSVPGDYHNVIFTSFDVSQAIPDWAKKKSQTEDLIYDGVNAYYVFNTGWQSSFAMPSRQKIGDLYFNLDDVNMTASVTYQEQSSDNYSGLITADIPSSITYNTQNYSVTGIGDNAFRDCFALTSVNIPNSVITIGSEAFRACKGLTSVNIGNNVTSIGGSAFCGCSELTSITIPNSVKKIVRYAFLECRNLSSVIIPNSVTSIGESAFYGCHSLTSVIIGSGVTSISKGAFGETFSLISINVEPSNSSYCDIDGVLFSKNEKTLVQYPVGRTATSFTIPNDVTDIGYIAFFGCYSLSSITIPASVTNIGDYAFYNCSNLTSIICEAENPPVCGSGVFDYVDKSIPLYIPTNSIEAYSEADEWKKFTNRKPLSALPTTIEDIRQQDTSTAEQVHKVMRDGVMYILMPNSRMYDIRGAEMK